MTDASFIVNDAHKISVILFKIGGSLSMAGSLLIMRDAWIKFRDKKDISLTASLVFELSIFDFFSSFFGPFLGTWLVPKETGAYLASGTTTTCSVQGLVASTFYSAAALCNASLAVAYCFVIKRGWADDGTQRVGNWMLRGLPLASLCLSVPPLFDKAYNFSGVASCSIISYPLGCDSDNPSAECTRGPNAVYFRVFAFFALFIANAIIVASIFMLIHSVWVIERKMDRFYAMGRARQKKSLKTTWQGIWYIAAFVLAWWPYTIYNSIKTFTAYPPRFLQILYVVTWPAQGAFNALVYFRPKYLSDRERHERDTRLSSVRRILRLSEFGVLSASSSEQKSGDVISPKKSGDDSVEVVVNNVIQADQKVTTESQV